VALIMLAMFQICVALVHLALVCTAQLGSLVGLVWSTLFGLVLMHILFCFSGLDFAFSP
jgi:hypothetical protein